MPPPRLRQGRCASSLTEHWYHIDGLYFGILSKVLHNVLSVIQVVDHHVLFRGVESAFFHS